MVVTGSKREGGCGSLDKSFKVYSHTQTQIQGNVERTKKTQSTMQNIMTRKIEKGGMVKREVRLDWRELLKG